MAGIAVLGPVTVGDGGSSLSPRDRVVLSVLVARRGREVSADTLAEALWGEDLPASSVKVVQGCIARLRRRLGVGAIVTGRSGYRLAVPAEDVDAGRFERLLQRVRELLALDHPDQAAYTAGEALALWHGDPLPDLEDWEPGRGEAQRLTELRLQAEELRLAALLACGRHAEVLAEGTLRVQEEPLREHRWALLARAQYQDGRQSDALATLRRAREVLLDELGLDPGSELVRLEQAVLEQDAVLTVAPATSPAAVCPWPGLAPYHVEDADTFFGRDTELTECLERLSRTGFLAVVGPSGCGKSSLVRAGLGAQLKHQGRRVHVITPGTHPHDTLTAATSGPGGGTVLVVDQCEEVFAPAVPEPVRAAFLDGVVEHTREGRVVITLRADRLAELAAYPQVARRVEDGLYLLKGIGEEGVREAIERPARQAGLLLEQGLIDLLARDVEDEPGSLPLLAHALRETWRRRQGNTLTVEGYRASGGIRGAVAQSAERVFEDASEEQRRTLRELFLRMVQAGPTGQPVRTSLPRDKVTADAEHTVLIEQLVRARLVTAEADRLQIAHEALARAWPRLRSWLADDVEGERIRHHLDTAADAWHAMGRPDSELYRGARLAAAREWRDTGDHRLSEVETDFLRASEAAHQSLLAGIEAEAQRHRLANRRLRLLVVGVTLLALVAAGFGTVARSQWRESQDAQALAMAETARARSHELSATAITEIGRNPALAKSLAVVAAPSAPTSPQTLGALHRTLSADRVVSRVSMNHFAHRMTATLHPDGTRVAMSGENAEVPALAVEVHDALTGDLVWEWVRPEGPGHESAVVAGAAWSTEGSLLAGGVVWNPHHYVRLGPPLEEADPPVGGLLGVHLWDASTYEPVAVLDVGPCGGWPLKASADKVLVRRLAAPPDASPQEQRDVLRDCRWGDGALDNVVVDVGTGEAVSLGHTSWDHGGTIGVAMSGDGTVGAVFDEDSRATVLVDVESGEELRRVPASMPHDLDPGGEHVLVQDDAPTVRWVVAAVEDGRTVAAYRGHTASSLYGAFGADGSTVLTTAIDNTLVEWSAEDGLTLHRTPGTGEGRPSSALGRWALVPRPSTYGAVLVDRDAAGETWSAPSCAPGGFGGFGAADQLRVADGSVLVGRSCGVAEGNLESFALDGSPQFAATGANWAQGMEVSPDGRHVVAQSGEGPHPLLMGPLEVRDTRTGEVTLTLEGTCTWSNDEGPPGCTAPATVPFPLDAWRILWSPDGRWIVALGTGQAGEVVAWDASTGGHVVTLAGEDVLEGGGTRIVDGVFSPASDRLVLTTGSGVLVAVDTDTWEPVVAQPLDIQNNGAASPVGYSADGTLVVVSPFRENVTLTSVLLTHPETLRVTQVWSNVTEGSVRSAEVSPDGTRLALATSTGSVDVWDLGSGTLLDRADPGVGRLQGARWLDDDDLVLLGNAGEVLTVTSDPQRLLSLTRASLTRGLTPTECAAYGVVPCPDLATLRGDEPSVPEELRGTYALSWRAQDLQETVVRHYEQVHENRLDPGALAEIEHFTGLLAGDYRLALGETSYTITRGEGEVWCAGSVTTSPTRPGRLLLGAESGSWCLDFHYAEVGWDLVGDELHLLREHFRGPHVDAALWTSKPLRRVDPRRPTVGATRAGPVVVRTGRVRTGGVRTGGRRPRRRGGPGAASAARARGPRG